MAAFARDETEKKARRQRRQRQQAAEEGRQSGGRRPFGYAPDGLHLDPREARMRKAGYEQFLGGVSLGSIARQWNARGMTTPQGNIWRLQSVRAILANP